MDDDVEVYENCFCYTRKVKEYSEPISCIHKVGTSPYKRRSLS
jgi:hypothetical protein